MRFMAALGFVAVLGLLNVAVVRAGDAEDLAAMKGTWSIVSAERDGKDVTDATVTMTFDGVSKVAVKRGDKQIFDGTAKLDAAKSPKTIDVTQESEGDLKGRTIPGIYELDGDTLKVCSGKERPTDFTAAAGSNRFLRVYKRAK
jgi:uncharacterized protein (TIGR03067 family)